MPPSHNDLANVNDMRPYKWPDILFSELAESFTHISCDTSTMLTVLSQITWNPDDAVKNIAPGDKVLRDKQIEHERAFPNAMRNFISNLLRSGLRIALAYSQYRELLTILDHYAGSIERKRYQALVESQILQVFLDEAIDPIDQLADVSYIDPAVITDTLSESCGLPQARRRGGGSSDYSSVTTRTLADAWAARRGKSRTPQNMNDASDDESEFAIPTPLYHTVDRVARPGAQSSDPTKVDWSLFPKPESDPAMYAGDVDLLSAERERSQTLKSGEESRRKRLRLTEDDKATNSASADEEIEILPLTMTLNEEELRQSRKRGESSQSNSASRRQELLAYLSIFGVPARTTRRVSTRHIKWLNASFRCNFPILTGDFGLINALKGQKIHLDNMKVAMTHPPRSLCGC